MASRWTAARGRLAAHPRYPQIVLGAALFGLFTTNWNVSVLAVVIPRLATEFAAPKTTVTWVVVAPLLAFAVLGPTAGKLGDLYGRRKVYLTSLAGVVVFAVFSASAQSIGQLIAFRTLAMVFGASTGPAGMAIITALFPRERRVQALGYWGLVLAGGPVLGMVVGGPIVDAIGWRWLFIPQVPLALLGLVAAAFVLPETTRATSVRFDVVGSAALAVAVGSLLVAVNRGPEWGWSAPAVVGLFVLSPLAAIVFTVVERRTDHPLIPFAYFRRRNFAVPMLAQFFVNFAYQGGFVLVPLMLGEVFDYSSTRTSAVTVSRPLFYGLAGPLAGWLAVRIGERSMAVGGSALVAVSCVMLANVHGAGAEPLVFAALAIAGMGLGTMVPSMMATTTRAVADSDLGVTAATSQMMMMIGTVLGMQVGQTVQVAREPVSGLLGSYDEAFLLGAFVAVVGVVLAWFVRSSDRPGPAGVPAGGQSIATASISSRKSGEARPDTTTKVDAG